MTTLAPTFLRNAGLRLMTFFTAGPKEVRAWAVRQGATATQAAGRIHADFGRGFIRAEVTAFEDFIACGGEQGAKEAGKLRLEGKDYRVQEGDVVHFRFNVRGRALDTPGPAPDNPAPARRTQWLRSSAG